MRTSGYFMMDDEFSVWTFTVWPASCPRPAAGVHVPVHAHVAIRTTAHVDLAAAAWWDSDSDSEQYTGFPDRHILWYGLPIQKMTVWKPEYSGTQPTAAIVAWRPS